MEEGASEVWLCPLCVLMIATSAAVLLLWGRGGRSAGLMVVGVLLCCVIPAGCFILALLSVGYTVIHCTAGRQELLLSAQGKSVLITGCDSGFGHNLAKLLDRAGVKVYAGVLKENGAGAQELRRVSSPQLTVLQLDITDTNQISKTLQFIKSQTGETGEVPFPGFAAYGSSKAALTAYSGVLRQELSQWGVKVAIIQPGCFRTNILGNEEEWSKIEKEILSSLIQEVREAYGEEYICSLQRRLSALTTAGSTDTTPVLDAITHALFAERPRGFYRPGPSAVSLSLLHMFCPTWLFDLVFSKITRYNRVKPAGVVSK
ncbi:estradiol 17-beta-dehydrogenase 2 isoform X2 [Pygocentrus nattereri]|uniref:estradiol 17-beta-dehydrogenase 2 isoform X2 n=1 Tax=Pygocentrus nattereri TaxID=42514 RepID=UPI001890D705|nr:estradiol 17-beta-dehydrogenase 2 isoform X2 [Pygocentrus nattereri]